MLALLATACAASTLTDTRTLAGGITVTASVVDRSGLVDGVQVADASVPVVNSKHGVSLENVHGDTSLVLVSWLGPDCSSSATITIGQAVDRISLTVNELRALQTCTNDVGRPRAARIHFKRAVPVDTIDAANISYESPVPTQ